MTESEKIKIKEWEEHCNKIMELGRRIYKLSVFLDENVEKLSDSEYASYEKSMYMLRDMKKLLMEKNRELSELAVKLGVIPF